MRPDFSTTLRGTQRYRTSPNGEYLQKGCVSGYASEIIDGQGGKKKPEGWIPPTSYSMTRNVMQAGYGSNSVTTYKDGKRTGYYETRDWLYSSSSDGKVTMEDIISLKDRSIPLGMIDDALTDARLDMKSADVNLAVAFAERNQTARLVGDTALKLTRSVRSLRRGDFQRAAKHLGIVNPRKPRGSSVTSKWLELQYGWKPLLSDVYGATEALSKRGRHDWIVTAKAARKERINVSKRTENAYYIREDRANGWKGVYVRVDAIPKNDLLKSFTSLGVTNPLLVAWELVPFSFVVDWFLPIGNYIDTLDAMLGYGESWCSISEFCTVDAVSQLVSGTVEGTLNRHYDITASATASKLEYRRLERSASNTVPLPVMPHFKNPASLGHMANGLSLLAQAFGSGRR